MVASKVHLHSTAASSAAVSRKVPSSCNTAVIAAALQRGKHVGFPALCPTPLSGTFFLCLPNCSDLLALRNGVVDVYHENIVAPGGSVGGLVFVEGAAGSGPAILFTDMSAHCVKQLDLLSMQISLVAGVPRRQGHRDGPAHQATFRQPCGIAFLSSGEVVICDAGNHCIRAIARTLDGSDEVITIAGQPESSGTQDGVWTSSRFECPVAVLEAAGPAAAQWTDSSASRALLIGDLQGQRLRLISCSEKTQFWRAQWTSSPHLAHGSEPTSIAELGNGLLVLNDLQAGGLRWITPDWSDTGMVEFEPIVAEKDLIKWTNGDHIKGFTALSADPGHPWALFVLCAGHEEEDSMGSSLWHCVLRQVWGPLLCPKVVATSKPLWAPGFQLDCINKCIISFSAAAAAAAASGAAAAQQAAEASKEYKAEYIRNSSDGFSLAAATIAAATAGPLPQPP